MACYFIGPLDVVRLTSNPVVTVGRKELQHFYFCVGVILSTDSSPLYFHCILLVYVTEITPSLTEPWRNKLTPNRTKNSRELLNESHSIVIY